MDIQHLNIKFFVQDPEAVDLEAFLGIFNGWIQVHAAEELLVDVADYRHVFNGPGVVLIGHQANYSIDKTGGRLGLLYNRKTPLDGSTRDKLIQAARAALTAARWLESQNGLKFIGQEAQLFINDRLIAPNTAGTFASLEPDLKAFFDTLYKGAAFELDHTPDARERFQVDVKAAGTFDVDALLQNLGVPFQDASREQVHV